MDSLYARNISDDHPAVQILHDLETKSYYVDEDMPGYILARQFIGTILRWAGMLGCRLMVRCMYCGFAFLTQLPRVWLSLIPTLI